MSQSSYHRAAFERWRATKRKDTIMSIKDHINILVPSKRACSVNGVVDTALSELG